MPGYMRVMSWALFNMRCSAQWYHRDSVSSAFNVAVWDTSVCQIWRFGEAERNCLPGEGWGD